MKGLPPEPLDFMHYCFTRMLLFVTLNSIFLLQLLDFLIGTACTPVSLCELVLSRTDRTESVSKRKECRINPYEYLTKFAEQT